MTILPFITRRLNDFIQIALLLCTLRPEFSRNYIHPYGSVRHGFFTPFSDPVDLSSPPRFQLGWLCIAY